MQQTSRETAPSRCVRASIFKGGSLPCQDASTGTCPKARVFPASYPPFPHDWIHPSDFHQQQCCFAPPPTSRNTSNRAVPSRRLLRRNTSNRATPTRLLLRRITSNRAAPLRRLLRRIRRLQQSCPTPPPALSQHQQQSSSNPPSLNQWCVPIFNRRERSLALATFVCSQLSSVG